jgi:site-specific recombinase XerD
MFAAHALQHGMSVPDVARLLGQRSTATTLRYYHNFVPEEAERLKEKVRAMYAAHGAPGYKKPKSGAKPHARRA